MQGDIGNILNMEPAVGRESETHPASGKCFGKCKVYFFR